MLCELCTAMFENLPGLRKFSEDAPQSNGGHRDEISFRIVFGQSPHPNSVFSAFSVVESSAHFGYGSAALGLRGEKLTFAKLL